MDWSLNTLPAMFNLYANLQPSAKRIVDFLNTPVDREEHAWEIKRDQGNLLEGR